MIKRINNSVDWLITPTRGFSVGEIRGVFPDIYKRYYKIYLPFALSDDFPEDEYPAEAESIEELNRRTAIGKLYFEAATWEKIRSEFLRPVYLQELTEKYGLSFREDLGIQEVYRHLGKKPIQLQRLIAYEVAIIDKLVTLLNHRTKIRLFDYGNFQLSTLDITYQQDWLKKIKLGEWSAIFKQQNELLNQPFPYLSAYLFPKNRSWCIASGSRLGGHFLLLATNEEQGHALEALAKAGELEVLRLQERY